MAHGNSWRECEGPGLETPPEYDMEQDPDQYVAALELIVAQLKTSLKYWSRHHTTCPARHGSFFGLQLSSPDSCLCGLKEALDGTLWDGGDHADLKKALAWLEGCS